MVQSSQVPDRDAPYRPITMGLTPGAGVTIRTIADLDGYLGAVADAGFRAVSLSGAHMCGDPASAARLLRTHGLACSDLMSVRVTRDEDASLEAARALRPAIEAVGAAAVLTMLWTRVSGESLDRLGRVADLLGVPVALEFAPGPVATLEAAEAVVGVVGPDRATILADTFHFFRGGSTRAMLESVPVEHIGIVQFNDALPAESDDYMHETIDRRAWPGDGEFDLDWFTTTLRQRGWRGVVAVEVLSAELRRLPVAEYARRGYQATVPYWS
jgi:sugar phosphate isomerase/epimerase